MCIAKVDITTQAVGVIVPEKNITQLGTMVTGEIVAVNYKQGDVVMWDNRSLMHYAINDYSDQPRYMERTTNIGEKPS